MVNTVKSDSLFMSTIDEITDVFGASVGFYVPFLDEIWPNVLNATYKFEDVTSFESSVRSGKYSIAKANEVYWRELLYRTHISVSGSLIRSCRLMDATVREYHAANLPGTASCARAMLEGVADSMEALIHVPLTLAQRRDLVNQCLSGSRNDQLYGCKDLEEAMFHFTLARRLRREEKRLVPPSHEAKTTAEYLGFLQRAEVSGTKELYGELCQLSHPTASSVLYMFSSVGEGALRMSARNDTKQLDDLMSRYRLVFGAIPEVSFNPILLCLRVFQEFALFPPIHEMFQINFDNVGGWAKIEKLLNAPSGNDVTRH